MATEAQKKTVAEGMAQRRIFDSLASAIPYLQNCANDFSDFAETTLIVKGGDENGDIDPALYENGMVPMVTVLKNRGDGGSKVKAVIVTPVPTLDALLATPEGRAWVQDKIDTQLNHVAVAKLRDAEDVEAVADQIPLTVEAFITSNRGAGGVMETFNELAKALSAAFGKKFPAWEKQRILKNDLKKACESRAYALQFFPTLEDRGEGKESLFVMFCQLGINTAKKQGKDPAIFDRWLNTRNAKTFELEEEEVTLDDLMEEFDAKAAEPEQAPAE